MKRFVNHVKLQISAVKPEQYPRQNWPEVAVVGRSNVGKSALTNVLVSRHNYAHMSNEPGKTQTLNFYNVEDQFFIVDIPGYGFAKVSRAEREKWADMIDIYLKQRKPLKGVMLLVDGRRAPSKMDVQMSTWLQYYGINPLIVATKMDKVKRSQWNKEARLILQTMRIKPNNLVLFSSQTKMGYEQIWQWIKLQTNFQTK